MKLRYKLLSIAALLGAIFMWGRRSVTPQRSPNAPAVLPSNDIEQIHVDPSTHKLIVTTPRGTQTLTLPDRQSTIDVRKDGSVSVSASQFGLEHHVFVGATMADAGRLAAGIDGVYYKRLDLGVGAADQIAARMPVVFGKLTYNFYGAMQVGVVYQSNRYIGGILSVRLF